MRTSISARMTEELDSQWHRVIFALSVFDVVDDPPGTICDEPNEQVKNLGETLLRRWTV